MYLLHLGELGLPRRVFELLMLLDSVPIFAMFGN